MRWPPIRVKRKGTVVLAPSGDVPSVQSLRDYLKRQSLSFGQPPVTDRLRLGLSFRTDGQYGAGVRVQSDVHDA